MRNQKYSSIVLILLLLIGAYLIFSDYYEKKLLLNSKTTIGILVKKKDGRAVHDTANGTFEYIVGKEKKKFTESGIYSFMNIGDTVLIKYSVENSNVATVVDKYFMKKYNSKKRGKN